MRYLKRYKIFESSERNKDVSSLLGNNQGYYNLFDKFHKSGISIERLSELINRIREDRNLIKINLTTLETIEQVDDYLTKVEEESKYNKVLDQLSNRYNNLLSDKVKSLLYDNRDDIELLKMFFRKIKVYKDSSQFYTALDNFIKNNKGDFNLKSILPKIDKTSEIIHKDESLLIIKINTFDQSKLLGSQNWCISRQEHYFNSYSNNRKQYFIWDFTMPSHSKLSQIGVTLEISGKYHTAHYKDDSQCSTDYVTDNFGDYLEMHKWIYNEMKLGRLVVISNIISVFSSDKISKDDKLKLAYSKDFVAKIIITPQLFRDILNIIEIDFESMLVKLDNDFKKLHSPQITNILVYLISKNIDISKLIPLVYLEIGGPNSIIVISKAISEYNLTHLNLRDTNVRSSDILLYDRVIQDKLLDILVDQGVIDHFVLKHVSKKKYDEIVEKYKNKNFLHVPVKSISFISIESIIRDFDFELTKNLHSSRNNKVIEALHRLYHSKTHQLEILEMFRTKGSSEYNNQISILNILDDVKLIDGKYTYHVSDEVVEYFETKEYSNGYSYVPKHHLIDRTKIIRYLKKDYTIGDSFDEDIQKFYKKEFKETPSIAQVMKSPFYIKYDIEDKNDVYTIELKNWSPKLVFDVPLSGFYNAWEMAKKQYLENISLDLWIGFSSAFYNHFGFENNLEKRESSFYHRTLVINPFKIWAIRKLWSMGPDSSEFSDYIMDYCRLRDFYFIEWDYLATGESFHYWLCEELKKVCSEYNKHEKK